jgi:hypothetical protein
MKISTITFALCRLHLTVELPNHVTSTFFSSLQKVFQCGRREGSLPVGLTCRPDTGSADHFRGRFNVPSVQRSIGSTFHRFNVPFLLMGNFGVDAVRKGEGGNEMDRSEDFRLAIYAA